MVLVFFLGGPPGIGLLCRTREFNSTVVAVAGPREAAIAYLAFDLADSGATLWGVIGPQVKYLKMFSGCDPATDDVATPMPMSDQRNPRLADGWRLFDQAGIADERMTVIADDPDKRILDQRSTRPDPATGGNPAG